MYNAGEFEDVRTWRQRSPTSALQTRIWILFWLVASFLDKLRQKIKVIINCKRQFLKIQMKSQSIVIKGQHCFTSREMWDWHVWEAGGTQSILGSVQAAGSCGWCCRQGSKNRTQTQATSIQGKWLKKKKKKKTAKKTEEEALLWVPGLLPSYTRSILGAGTGHLCLPVNPSSWPKSLDERKD